MALYLLVRWYLSFWLFMIHTHQLSQKQKRFAEVTIVSIRQISHNVSIVFYNDCVLIGRIFRYHSSIQDFSYDRVSNFFVDIETFHYGLCWYTYTTTITYSWLVLVFSSMATENSSVIVICLSTLLLLLIRKISNCEQTYHGAMCNTEWRKCAKVNTCKSQLKKLFHILPVVFWV